MCLKVSVCNMVAVFSQSMTRTAATVSPSMTTSTVIGCFMPMAVPVRVVTSAKATQLSIMVRTSNKESSFFIGYIFYQDMNHAYMPTEIRVCDILYLLLENLKPSDQTIVLKQEELSNMVGISSTQLERILKDLRADQIIETSRGKIRIIDVTGLKNKCSTELREP